MIIHVPGSRSIFSNIKSGFRVTSDHGLLRMIKDNRRQRLLPLYKMVRYCQRLMRFWSTIDPWNQELYYGSFFSFSRDSFEDNGLVDQALFFLVPSSLVGIPLWPPRGTFYSGASRSLSCSVTNLRPVPTHGLVYSCRKGLTFLTGRTRVCQIPVWLVSLQKEILQFFYTTFLIFRGSRTCYTSSPFLLGSGWSDGRRRKDVGIVYRTA